MNKEQILENIHEFLKLETPVAVSENVVIDEDDLYVLINNTYDINEISIYYDEQLNLYIETYIRDNSYIESLSIEEFLKICMSYEDSASSHKFLKAFQSFLALLISKK